MADERLIDAYGEYSLVAADNTDYVLMFANETIGVYDNCGHILAEFDPDDIPKVDAVEVVRCEKCKHYKQYTSYKSDQYCNWGKCLLINMDVDMPTTGFCCFGERRIE